jgi:O-antigen/teichoic acid export membrane protein
LKALPTADTWQPDQAGDGLSMRRYHILPNEHGAWIWWIGPLLIGVAAAGQTPSTVILLAATALSAFLLRQPATIVVKVLSGRRSRDDLRPAATALMIDGLFLVALTAGLIARGHAQVLVLALPGAAVFAWHLLLISRREERGQMGIEVVGAGTRALAAPGAYWVAGGGDPLLPWLLWGLCWLQSAASIVLVYFRLGFRKLDEAPPPARRVALARRSLAYHAFNLLVSAALAAVGQIPSAMTLAFGLMLADAVESIVRPPVGLPPARIGIRQLASSTVFVALTIVGFVLT